MPSNALGLLARDFGLFAGGFGCGGNIIEPLDDTAELG